MSSNRPYLVRAFYEWLLDNDQTPHLLVEVAGSSVEVPQQFVEDGRITLNINPSAVRNLELGNEYISFNASFGGKPMDVLFPVASVLGIYAQESGSGMLFPEDDAAEDESEPEETPPRGRPSLKVIK
ncbi:MAG: ClpXP protease specificity-enhancing factor [Gammaproteobacteria bacterium]|nr:ClpXP protease specificity-enhancing factor [Gammaproteobacteria bacterium]